MNGLAENTLVIDFDVDNPTNSFTRLKELGSKQGYVTYDDILHLFPETEQDVDYLDQIFVAIRDAGILFVEDDSFDDAPNENSADEDENEVNDGRSVFREDNLLSNIEPDNLVGLYFCEATRLPLLTLEEEVDLAKRIERGLLAREEISDVKSMSAKRHEELLLWIDDSWTAVDHLIAANSRLVISIAKKHVNRGVPFLDLIQEGNIGLMRSVKKFDYRRGYKFSTYATWWIRQAVTRAIADQSRTIRIPVHMSDQLAKMFRAKYGLTQRLGYAPSVDELADELNMPPSKVNQMLKMAQYPLSLEMPIIVDEDSVLGDFIEDSETPPPDETATDNLLRQHLEIVLSVLPAREVQILKLRFGLPDGKQHTLQEVGEKMGVTRERIRQIEAKALSRLRQPSILHKLRGYLGNN